jgi:hypothetical protein
VANNGNAAMNGNGHSKMTNGSRVSQMQIACTRLTIVLPTFKNELASVRNRIHRLLKFAVG